ncbi:MAG: type VII toxin-antitoxin system MntA family adenylyltransferase antitoxin [Nitrososphaerales archaeon]
MSSKLSEKLERLGKELSKNDNVLLAYIFGSQVKGFVTPLSDIDIAVILKDDSLERFSELLGKIAKLLDIVDDKVDLVDLKRAPISLKYNITKYGVKIVDRGLEDELIQDLIYHYPALKEEFDIAIREWLSKDPKVDKAIVSRRVDEVLRNAALLRDRYTCKPLEWIISDLERMLAFERAVERIVEAIIDVCRHVVSAKRIGLVESYSEYPLRLAEQSFMEVGLARKISELVGLRNILSHRYLDVDYDKLYFKAKEIVDDIAPRFIEWVRKILSGT